MFSGAIIKGKFNGRTVIITVSKDLKVRISDDLAKLILRKLLKKGGNPIGGTFYPERGTPLYILAAIYALLDKVDSVEGDFNEIPYEEGVIY